MEYIKQLRCPCCGNRSIVYSALTTFTTWHARCPSTECYAVIGAPSAIGNTKAAAVERWNDLVRPLWEAKRQRALDSMAISLDDWLDA